MSVRSSPNSPKKTRIRRRIRKQHQGVSTHQLKKSEEKDERDSSTECVLCAPENHLAQQNSLSRRQHVQSVSPDTTPMHIQKGLAEQLQHPSLTASSSLKIAVHFHHEGWVILNRRPGSKSFGGDVITSGFSREIIQFRV
jgi:hypothetical protein